MYEMEYCVRHNVLILLLIASQFCFAQTIVVPKDVSQDHRQTKSAGNNGETMPSADTLSEECEARLKKTPIEKISFDRFIGYPSKTGLWIKVADDCGVTKGVELIQEFEYLHPELTREKIGWIRLSIAKLFLYSGQRDKALQAFDYAIIRPEPMLENYEIPAAFHLENAWNHYVRAYIALTQNDKGKLLEIRERLSQETKVFGEIPYLNDVDALVYNIELYQK
jgi:hypothetical protein